MRRIDVIGIGIGAFVAGGAIYLVLAATGMDSIDAGIWSQVIFLGGLVGWVFTYLTRVFTRSMTYNRQVQDYEDAVLQRRLDEMTPEELEQLQAEVEQEKAKLPRTDGKA